MVYSISTHSTPFNHQLLIMNNTENEPSDKVSGEAAQKTMLTMDVRQLAANTVELLVRCEGRLNEYQRVIEILINKMREQVAALQPRPSQVTDGEIDTLWSKTQGELYSEWHPSDPAKVVRAFARALLSHSSVPRPSLSDGERKRVETVIDFCRAMSSVSRSADEWAADGDAIAHLLSTDRAIEQRLSLPGGGRVAADKIADLIKVQCVKGTIDHPGAEEYMRGMANGLICAHSVLTGEDPKYVEHTPIPSPAAVSDAQIEELARRMGWVSEGGADELVSFARAAIDLALTTPQSTRKEADHG